MPKVTGKLAASISAIKERAYLGVDPGTQGGMTVIGVDGRPKGFLEFGNVTQHWISEWLNKLSSRFELRAAIEQVHAMPKQGVTAMFTFGKQLGFVQGLIVGARIPYIEVTPQKWQKFFSVPPRKEKTKTEHKKILQSKAHQLFPAYVKDISRAVADSVLIAEYYRLTEVRASA